MYQDRACQVLYLNESVHAWMVTHIKESLWEDTSDSKDRTVVVGEHQAIEISEAMKVEGFQWNIDYSIIPLLKVFTNTTKRWNSK